MPLGEPASSSRNFVRLLPDQSAAYARTFSALLAVARPGQLFTERSRVADWLRVLTLPRPRGKPATLEVHLASGLPSRRVLMRLWALQQGTRAFLAEHRLSPRRARPGFHLSLASAALPPVAETTARLVHTERAHTRLVVTHDALEPGTQLLVRLTAHVTQHRQRLVVLRQDSATASPALTAALAAASRGRAAQTFEALEALGLLVHEVTATELGPLVWSRLPAAPAAPPWVESIRQAIGPGGKTDEAALSLVLERVGAEVPRDFCADPFGELPRLSLAQTRRGSRAFRERRIICTPALEAPLRARCHPCLVRSR